MFLSLTPVPFLWFPLLSIIYSVAVFQKSYIHCHLFHYLNSLSDTSLISSSFDPSCVAFSLWLRLSMSGTHCLYCGLCLSSFLELGNPLSLQAPQIIQKPALHLPQLPAQTDWTEVCREGEMFEKDSEWSCGGCGRQAGSVLALNWKERFGSRLENAAAFCSQHTQTHSHTHWVVV